MKSAVFYGKGDMRLEDIARPTPGKGEVLVQVKACGVCGSDVHIFEGGKGSTDSKLPVVMGHEYAGLVVEVGTGVTSLQVGDRVCVDPNQTCGMCYPCRQGYRHFCENTIGYGTHRNGGYEEYSVVDETVLYKLGDNTSYEQAAMTEPLACCVHGIDLAEIQAGNNVVIIGGGMIGLLMVQLAKLAGAGKVAMITRSAEKQLLALELGADYAIDPTDCDVKGSLIDCGMEHIQHVIECVGKIETMEMAIELADIKGIVVLFGLSDPEAKMQVNPYSMFTRELTIKSSYINPNTHDRALRLIDEGLIDVSSMVAGVYGLDRLVDILTSPELRKKGKYIINPAL